MPAALLLREAPSGSRWNLSTMKTVMRAKTGRQGTIRAGCQATGRCRGPVSLSRCHVNRPTAGSRNGNRMISVRETWIEPLGRNENIFSIVRSELREGTDRL